jgi:hypothetical protein
LNYERSSKNLSNKYGEFFPVEISPWGYNETTAQEFFPLDKKEIGAASYNWIDIDKYKGSYQPTINSDDLPDDIKDASDKILNEIIECKKCRHVYKIIKQELEFYKKENIALPRFCPDCRYLERFNKLNHPKIYYRRCQCGGATSENGVYQNTASHSHHKKDHCPNEFETTYSPERKEIIYCEVCYQQEIV